MNMGAENKVMLSIPIPPPQDSDWEGDIRLGLIDIGRDILREDKIFTAKRTGRTGAKSGAFDERLSELVELLNNDLDVEGLKEDIDRRYLEFICDWLELNKKANAYELDLKFSVLRQKRLVEVTGSTKPIPVKWENSTLALIEKDIKRTLGLAKYHIPSPDFLKDAICRHLNLDKVESVFFGCDEMEVRIQRLARSWMKNEYWIRDAVEQMQESIIDDNEDVFDLLVAVIGVYQAVPRLDKPIELSGLMKMGRPFWCALYEHALEQAQREIEDMDEGWPF